MYWILHLQSKVAKSCRGENRRSSCDWYNRYWIRYHHIRGNLFYHIVETAGLEESNLKPADLKACTYDQKPMNLDGQLDLHITLVRE